MLGADSYTSAREFFEAVRDASREADRTRRQIERMESSEGVRAQGYEPRVSGTRSDVNGTSRVDARMDYEALWERRLDEDYALIDEACAVIYGPDNRSGIESIVGSAVADAMWWRFCAAETWRVVSAATFFSTTWCKHLVEVGLDAVDALGFERAKSGAGMAEG